MNLTPELGSLNSAADLERCLNSLRSRASVVRKQMKEIWQTGNLERLDDYAKMNEKLRRINIFRAELEYRKNML